MPVARQSASVLAKFVQSGGGSSFAVPPAWSQSSYGSGWPIAPISAPKDVEIPRTIDYPIAVNSTLTPRISYGLMPFAALLAAYENVAEVRSPVALIHRELQSFIPHLVDAEGNAIEDHDYAWMTKSPDRKTPFSVWLTRLLKSAKVYDASAIYMQRNQGVIDALHYIDGSTLFVIVDQFGNIPEPEYIDDYVRRVAKQGSPTAKLSLTGGTQGLSSLAEFVQQYIARQRMGLPVPQKIPAYTQVIKGTPFSWWSADDIWYMPQSRRMNAPYGESFIEMAWAWIMVIVNLTAFELGHYRTGNMPEGFVTVPKDWFSTPDQLMAAEMLFNQRMTSDHVTERNRLRLFPDGSKYFPTKKPDFPRDLYKQAWNNILYAIGIPPSEFGDVPGGGLGGKGFKEEAASDFGRQTINPHRQFIADLFNYALEADGVDDVVFSLDYPLEEIDPDKQKQSVYDGMAHGTLSLNDGLGQLNLNPVGDIEDPNNIANKHLIVAGSTIYVIEDMQVQTGMAVPTYGGVPGGMTGGAPVGPETAAEQMGAEHTPQDVATLQQAIRHLQDGGTLDGKFISVPSAKKNITPDEPLKPNTPRRTDRFQFDEYEIIPGDIEKGWDESKHPRRDDGKFGEGAGNSSSDTGDDAEREGETDEPVEPEDTRQYRDFGAYPETMVSDSMQPSAPKPSDAQHEAMEYYRDISGNADLNRNLRTGQALSPEGERHTKQLDALLNDSKLEHDTMVYRGIPGGSRRMQQFEQQIKSGELRPGSTITDKGYASTTLDSNVANGTFAEDGGVIFRIKAPKGSNALYLNSASDKYLDRRYDGEFRDEKEVLLPRDAQFRVGKIEKQGNQYVVEMTYQGVAASAAKLAKAILLFQQDVNYTTKASDHDQRCGNCRWFSKQVNKAPCALVVNGGPLIIVEDGHCDRWEAIPDGSFVQAENSGDVSADNPNLVPGLVDPETQQFQVETGAWPETLATVPIDKGDAVAPFEPIVETIPSKIVELNQDDAHTYYGAPISREFQFDFPAGDHANGIEIIALCPEGLTPIAALWKPEGAEDVDQAEYVGGAQYLREEAGYLLSHSLGFDIVPVAYVTDSHDERGAAILYSANIPGKPMAEYAPEWIERAAVFDFISGQTDRGEIGHNYLTYVFDPARPVLIDNGMGFPADAERGVRSVFYTAWGNRSLSPETMAALEQCRDDVELWSRLTELVGEQAATNALERLNQLLNRRQQKSAEDELRAWKNKALKRSPLRKFTAQILPAHIVSYIWDELLALNGVHTVRLVKAVFDDAAYILGNLTLEKSYASTAAEFEAEVARLIDEANQSALTRTRFASSLRSALRRFGLMAFRDGMEDGGYSPESIDPDELDIFKAWQAESSDFVTNLGFALFKDEQTPNPEFRADMWVNKSLNDIYYAGLRIGAPTLELTWETGPTEKHCTSCAFNNGLTKSVDEWGKSGFPQDRRLACKGFKCQCLVRDKDGNVFAVR